ncbi:hypothetical protein ACIQMJ_08970 [Actinosynnema sp. NPDC091369]
MARLARAPLAVRPPQVSREVDAVVGEDEFVLRPDADGGLDLLRLVGTGAPLPTPGPGQVLLRPQACTVHFRDVLVALGIYPTDDGTLPRSARTPPAWCSRSATGWTTCDRGTGSPP